RGLKEPATWRSSSLATTRRPPTSSSRTGVRRTRPAIRSRARSICVRSMAPSLAATFAPVEVAGDPAPRRLELGRIVLPLEGPPRHRLHDRHRRGAAEAGGVQAEVLVVLEPLADELQPDGLHGHVGLAADDIGAAGIEERPVAVAAVVVLVLP